MYIESVTFFSQSTTGIVHIVQFHSVFQFGP